LIASQGAGVSILNVNAESTPFGRETLRKGVAYSTVQVDASEDVCPD
jgi:hypothetical protein